MLLLSLSYEDKRLEEPGSVSVVGSQTAIPWLVCPGNGLMIDLSSLDLFKKNEKGYPLKKSRHFSPEAWIQDGRRRHLEKNNFHQITKKLFFAYAFGTREPISGLNLLIEGQFDSHIIIKDVFLHFRLKICCFWHQYFPRSLNIYIISILWQ